MFDYFAHKVPDSVSAGELALSGAKMMEFAIMRYIGVIMVYWGYMGIMENKMETTIV